MQKKTYMKPLVSLYAIEALTIFAGSTDPSAKPVNPSGFQFEEDIISGDKDDVWEQQENNQKLTTRTQIDNQIKNMKKFLYSVFMLAAVVLAACSNDDNGDTQPKRGMTLNASVENLSSRATMTDESGTWKFAFAVNDQVSVSNSKISNYYTFTNNGSQFTSAQAEATTENADWYAYFPGNEVNLTNQTGDFANVANYFAVAGKTAAATTGEKGLSITLKPKVAVLRIVKVDNYGPCDIYLKTADGKYVSGLKAKKNEAGYEVEKSDTKVSVFQKASNGNAGIYYVIVPAGVKISVYNTNDENHIKTTKDAGLTAGRYYTLTTGPTTGTETATLAGGTTETVDWVQLWIGGPRFAVKNVAEPMTWYDATKKGDDFAWGSNWYVPSEEDLKIMHELLLKVQSEPTERKVSITGYPTLELITNTKLEENIVKITGFQPGYDKNSISLYNKIVAGLNTYRLWTATEKGGYGVDLQILEQDNYFCGGGFGYQTTKNQLILTRPILTAKTILWSNQKQDK